MTDEEFEEVEKSFKPEELEAIRSNQKAKDEEIKQQGTSGAYVFFNVLGILLIVAGLIIAISGAYVEVVKGSGYSTHTAKEFSTQLFFSTFIVYIVYACFCFCAASLFSELRTITNLLRQKK